MTSDFDLETISWEVPEYETHERSRNWYLIAGVIGALLLVYAMITSNFLFAGIIVIAAVVIILTDGKEPVKVRISLTDEGVEVGRKVYDYDEIKDFSIVYKPKL